MRKILAGLLLLTLTACEGTQMDGWGFPVGQDTQTDAAPLQKGDDFDARLQTITQKLDTAPVIQMGETQPAVTAAASPVTKEELYNNAAVTKIALIVPMSGAPAALGNSMLVAGQMALKDMGAENFQLLPRDSGVTAESGRAAIDAAIKDGARLILGPVFTDQVKVGRATAANAGVPMIGFTTDASVADNNTLVMGFLPSQQVVRVIDFAAARGAADVLVVAPPNQYGVAVTDTATRYKKLPAKIIAARSGEKPEALAAKIKAQLTPKTALLFAYDGETTARIIKVLDTMAIAPETTLMMGTGLLDDPKLATMRELENVYFASAPLDLRAKFDRKYRSIARQAPERLASLAYDGVALAVAVAHDSKNQASPFPQSAIHDKNGFAGIDGIFRFNNSGQVERGLSILTWKSGSLYEMDKAPKSF